MKFFGIYFALFYLLILSIFGEKFPIAFEKASWALFYWFVFTTALICAASLLLLSAFFGRLKLFSAFLFTKELFVGMMATELLKLFLNRLFLLFGSYILATSQFQPLHVAVGMTALAVGYMFRALDVGTMMSQQQRRSSGNIDEPIDVEIVHDTVVIDHHEKKESK